eukprot:6176443-Pleurochrysis_carterae.AAC.2
MSAGLVNGSLYYDPLHPRALIATAAPGRGGGEVAWAHVLSCACAALRRRVVAGIRIVPRPSRSPDGQG